MLTSVSISVVHANPTEALVSGLRSVAAAVWPMLLLLAGVAAFVLVLKSRGFKGWIGETTTTRFGLGKLNPNVYRVFHDIYLPRPDGNGTTQIDDIVVSEFGVFVIGTKNLSGWIFGGELDKMWTQQFPTKRVPFQNPLRQNWLHVLALREFLQLPESAFVPIVFLVGNATFKTPVPPGVLTRGLTSHITEYAAPLLDEDAVERAKARLGALDHSLDRRRARRDHIKGLRRRHET